MEKTKQIHQQVARGAEALQADASPSSSVQLEDEGEGIPANREELRTERLAVPEVQIMACDCAT